MKNLFLFFAPTLIAIIIFSVIINNISFPNTFIGNINVSLKTKNEILSILDKEIKKPIQIQIKERTYAYSPEQIGVVVDQKEIINKIFSNNSKFIINIYFFTKALEFKNVINPSITFSNFFEGWFSKTVFDFSTKKDEITFDNVGKKITYIPREEKYRIDISTLRELLSQQFRTFQNKTITPPLIKVEENHMKNTAKLLDETYQKIISLPIAIFIDPKNTNLKIILYPSELKQILAASYVNNSLKFDADKNILKSIIENKISSIFKTTEKAVDTDKIHNDILSLADSRALGIETNSIITTSKFQPNTNGDKSNKYIEIDISQQQMYIWDSGKIIAEHLVSTGLYYPTPPGQYKILSKANNAFSSIYRVWMPYWMAFYRAPDINAYLGIHELPYWIAGNGNQIRRPRDFLGSPHTGGCVSLDVGVAEKVYAWADLGTPVYIFN